MEERTEGWMEGQKNRQQEERMVGSREGRKEKQKQEKKIERREDEDLLFSKFVSSVGPAPLQSDDSMGDALILNVPLSNDLRGACALIYEQVR